MLNAREPRSERILVVEDEDAIRELVATALRFTGFEVESAGAGAEALRAARNSPFDLLVLDVNLPDIEGFTICRKLRDDGNRAAVIFLTARDDPADLRSGFLGGGDDYVTKPFSLEELMLRVDAVLRRSKHTNTAPSRLICGEVVLNEDAHRVWVGDEEVSLSPTEFRLLRYLLVNKDRVVSKNQILEHVWDYDFAGDQSAVETYVSYLRKKLGDRDAEMISTVRGFGYSMRSPEGQRQAS